MLSKQIHPVKPMEKIGQDAIHGKQIIREK